MGSKPIPLSRWRRALMNDELYARVVHLETKELTDGTVETDGRRQDPKRHG